MKTIFKTIFGSHLYGTNSPDSDNDFKGVMLPTKEQCFLNKIPKSIHSTTGKQNEKNTKDDVDEEIYSLQYFFQLAIQGEMGVIDMVHSPENLWITSSDIWKEIHRNRSKFYSKNMRGYLGYIKTQTAKYGVKGSRVASIENVIKTLEQFESFRKISDIFEKLPVDEFSYPTKNIINPKQPELRHYECCGKMITETVTVEYALNILHRIYEGYGTRAKQARDNSGIDWKAVSHAFRAGYQIKEILETGDLKYPLKQAPELLKIKLGQYHYLNDGIAEKLEEIISGISDLVSKSNLPENIDTKWFDNFIMECYDDMYWMRY
jgi:predicted nucleotidyltransferase